MTPKQEKFLEKVISASKFSGVIYVSKSRVELKTYSCPYWRLLEIRADYERINDVFDIHDFTRKYFPELVDEVSANGSLDFMFAAFLKLELNISGRVMIHEAFDAHAHKRAYVVYGEGTMGELVKDTIEKIGAEKAFRHLINKYHANQLDK